VKKDIRCRCLKWLVVLLAVAGTLFALATIANLVRFVESTRRVELAVVELCPAGPDSFKLTVRVMNGSKERLTVAGFFAEIRHDGNLIASRTLFEPVIVPSGKEYTRELLLTTPLSSERRPELTACGFPAEWEAAVSVQGRLPRARKTMTVKAQVGGDT